MKRYIENKNSTLVYLDVYIIIKIDGRTFIDELRQADFHVSKRTIVIFQIK
jgi:hypothetical protein